MDITQLGQIGLSFLLVVALMLGVAQLFKRFGLEKRWGMFKSASGLLHVEDSMFLDPKRRMVLVGTKDKRYLLVLDSDKTQLIDSWENKAP